MTDGTGVPVSSLAPIERPDGRLYRPRKIVAAIWDNEEANGRYDDYGVFVFGTHDVERARPLAEQAIKHFFDADLVPTEPECRWVRLGYHNGEQAYIDDPVRGRAAVQFHADYPEEADT
jgi:hypothetical protein